VRDGRFRLSWPARPKGPVTLVATDTLRNATTKRIWISIQPRRPAHPVRAVHVTFDGWADAKLRKGIVALIDQGRVNAVELDLKDESGTVGWDADVPLARTAGAIKPIVDLRAAVRYLHRRGIRVIGRLVCFRDPILAQASWKAGHRGRVVQTPSGSLYGGYGGFTNFADPAVRRYQVAVAVAAAKAGVAATRPKEVAQDIPAMAEHVDYVAPMVYPSHWAPGEYGVPNPNAEPYEIVRRSLDDFQKD